MIRGRCCAIRRNDSPRGATEAISLRKIDFYCPVPWEILSVADIHRCSFNQSQGAAWSKRWNVHHRASSLGFDSWTIKRASRATINIREVLNAVSGFELITFPFPLTRKRYRRTLKELRRRLSCDYLLIVVSSKNESLLY